MQKNWLETKVNKGQIQIDSPLTVLSFIEILIWMSLLSFSTVLTLIWTAVILLVDQSTWFDFLQKQYC